MTYDLLIMLGLITDLLSRHRFAIPANNDIYDSNFDGDAFAYTIQHLKPVRRFV